MEALDGVVDVMGKIVLIIIFSAMVLMAVGALAILIKVIVNELLTRRGRD